MALVISTMGAAGLVLLPFFEIPSAEAWGWLIASVIIHQIYFATVCLGYRFGDLSQVYPIQRGAAPLFVAIGGYLVIGETLTLNGAIAVGLISLAIFSLTLGRGYRFTGGRAIPIALMTGLLIGAYSVADGVGGRASGDVFGYIAWLFFLCALPFSAIIFWRRRSAISQLGKRDIAIGMAGGALSFFAYGFVIWAMSLTHLTYVSALRETSVILAAWIGSRLLGEPFGRHRIAAACTVALGVLFLQMSEAS